MRSNILLSLIFFFLVSCYKEDGPVKENIIGKTWTTSKVELEVSGIKTDVTSLVYQYIEACLLDNDIYFNENGTFIETEGDAKCSEGGPENLGTGSWTVSEDEKTLTKTYETTDVIQIWTIESSANNSFVLSTDDDLFQLGEGKTYITMQPEE